MRFEWITHILDSLEEEEYGAEGTCLMHFIRITLMSRSVHEMVTKGEKPRGKAAAIRDYVKANPDAGPQTVAAALKEQGFNCTPGYVSTIKSLSKKRGRKSGRKARGAATEGIVVSEGLSIKLLVQAKKLANQLGGIAQAKAAIDALARLGV